MCLLPSSQRIKWDHVCEGTYRKHVPIVQITMANVIWMLSMMYIRLFYKEHFVGENYSISQVSQQTERSRIPVSNCSRTPRMHIMNSAEISSVSIRAPGRVLMCHVWVPLSEGYLVCRHTQNFPRTRFSVSSTLTNSSCFWSHLGLGKGRVYLRRTPGVFTCPPASIPLSSSNWACRLGRLTPPLLREVGI